MLPPEVARAAAAHRARQQRLAAVAAAAGRRLWRRVDSTAIRPTWAQIAPTLLALLVEAQRQAAGGAQDYVAETLTAFGAVPAPAGTVAGDQLSGVASDGRDLPGLIAAPVFGSLTAIGDGVDAGQALRQGGLRLERILITQVQDTARVATGLGVVNDRTAHGYVRMLNPPSCARCAVLAGRFYRWNTGFQRHPHCDCVHVPAAENAPDLRTSPRGYFDSLEESEQDRVFGRAGAQAIRDGADIGQVVNARRGMYTAASPSGAVLATSEGATTRGLAGQRAGLQRVASTATRNVRLMPEGIYAEAARLGWSRDEVIRQLHRFGYIT